MERIDAHHHLWCYSTDEYAWIGPQMSALARDFLPDDLQRELLLSGIQGSVAVQARQTIAETHWLLGLAEDSRVIRGVVGWAPIASPEFPSILETLQPCKKLKGLRHVIQDEPDGDFILRPDFNAGIALLQQYSLVYDILIFEHHLPAAISFVDRHPKQVFVLDHVGKPRIKDRQHEPWRSNLRELARRENVFCKLSGLVTEADWTNWRPADLQPYLDVALQAFGPQRLMAGSDWPVCLLASSHERWFSTLQDFLQPLSLPEKQMILGGVASQVYSLNRHA